MYLRSILWATAEVVPEPKKLSKTKSLVLEPRSKILNVLQSARKEFVGTGKSKIGASDQKAVALIDGYIERVKNIKQPGVDPKLEQMLDQTQLRELVQSIRHDTRYDLPDLDPVNRAVQKVSAKIDSNLKENGNYAEVMKELAPATKSLKETASKFRLKFQTGIGFVSSDSTPGILTKSIGKNKPESQRILSNFSKQTGQDFIDKIRLTGAKEAFTAGTERSRGSARTLLGTILGGSMGGGVGGFAGGGVGSAIGALSGRSADYYGGSMAGKLIDAIRLGSEKSKMIPGLIESIPGSSMVASLLEAISKRGRLAPLIASTRQQ